VCVVWVCTERLDGKRCPPGKKGLQGSCQARVDSVRGKRSQGREDFHGVQLWWNEKRS